MCFQHVDCIRLQPATHRTKQEVCVWHGPCKAQPACCCCVLGSCTCCFCPDCEGAHAPPFVQELRTPASGARVARCGAVVGSVGWLVGWLACLPQRGLLVCAGRVQGVWGCLASVLQGWRVGSCRVGDGDHFMLLLWGRCVQKPCLRGGRGFLAPCASLLDD